MWLNSLRSRLVERFVMAVRSPPAWPPSSKELPIKSHFEKSTRKLLRNITYVLPRLPHDAGLEKFVLEHFTISHIFRALTLTKLLLSLRRLLTLCTWSSHCTKKRFKRSSPYIPATSVSVRTTPLASSPTYGVSGKTFCWANQTVRSLTDGCDFCVKLTTITDPLVPI